MANNKEGGQRHGCVPVTVGVVRGWRDIEATGDDPAGLGGSR